MVRRRDRPTDTLALSNREVLLEGRSPLDGGRVRARVLVDVVSGAVTDEGAFVRRGGAGVVVAVGVLRQRGVWLVFVLEIGDVL